MFIDSKALLLRFPVLVIDVLHLIFLNEYIGKVLWYRTKPGKSEDNRKNQKKTNETEKIKINSNEQQKTK